MRWAWCGEGVKSDDWKVNAIQNSLQHTCSFPYMHIASDQVAADDIRSVRPGFGLKSKYYDQVIGLRVP